MKIKAGVYTVDEYLEIVRQWRSRYAVNKLAVHPDPMKARFIENMKVTVDNGKVTLKEVA